MRFLIASLMLLALPAAAQEADPTFRTGPYLGVQPGQKDDAPGKVRLTSKGGQKQLTWVGFQMATEGGRVFLQTTDVPTWQVISTQPDQVVKEPRGTLCSGRPARWKARRMVRPAVT